MVKGSDDKLYVYGGYVGGKTVDELWTFAPKTNLWTKIQPNSTAPATPGARTNHAAVMWHYGDSDVMVVIGGTTESFDRLNDVWLYHVSRNVWEPMKSQSPMPVTLPARSEHSATLYNNQVIVFGGRDVWGKELNDVMVLDLLQGDWSLGSELCLKPSPDKSFVLASREPSSVDKSPGVKGQEGSFGLAAQQIQLMKPNMSMKVSPERVPKRTGSAIKSPRNRRRRNASPPKLCVAEIESALEAMKVLTPTTSAMLNSVVMKAGEKSLALVAPGSRQKRRSGGAFSLIKQIEMDNEYCVRGRVPCARSGHSAELSGYYMIVFAGDRTKVALNDIYLYELKHQQI
jgi:hypothetical protein